MFEAITTAGTGLQTYHTWLDAISNNIANVNDESSPNGQVFQTEYVQAQEITGNGGSSAVDTTGSTGSGFSGGTGDGIGQGVTVSGITSQSGNGELVYDPSNPLADKTGYVRHSTVDLSQQMGDLIITQRAYQANASVVTQAKETYEAAIAIGKGN